MSVPITQRNLLHNKGKFILHVLGIAAAFMLILLLFGFRNGMYSSISAYIEHIGVDLIVAQPGTDGFFSSASSLPSELHDALGNTYGVVQIDHILVSDTIFTHNTARTPVLLIGYHLESGFGGPWNIGNGRGLQADDEILLDTWLAWRSGVQVGDIVRLFGRSFSVVGLTRETSSWMSPYLFVSLSAAEDVLQAEGDASFFLLNLPTGTDTAAVRSMIERNFSNTQVVTPDQMAASDQQFLSTILDRPIAVMIIISGIIAIAIMGLITYTTVIGQMREYSVLKAIGASNRWLQSLALRESLFRTVLGFVVGVAFSLLASELIMQMWPQFTIRFHWQMLPVIGVAAILMTVIAAIWPIQRIATVDPAAVFKV